MKRLKNSSGLLVLIAISSLLIACGNKKKNNNDRGVTYSNPLAVKYGDPFILKASDGKYYMYGTDGSAPGFKVYESEDLADWKYVKMAYQGGKEDSWTKDSYWAPEVYERNGKYYMFFSANWKYNPNNEEEVFRIGVAVSDKPTGPFKDLGDRPIFDPGYPIIDANVLFDDVANKTYLYYSRCCYKHPVESEVADWAKDKGWYDEIEESWVYGVEMAPDFSGVIGEPQLLLRPPLKMNDVQAEWESRSVTARETNRRWTEGSYIFEHQDTYYMLYSANYFGGQYYAMGYATSKNPLGPFKKAENNPILQKNNKQGGDVTGTGHGMVLNLGDSKKLCVYHARTAKTGNDRVVFMDELEILEDGTLVVHGPKSGTVALK